MIEIFTKFIGEWLKEIVVLFVIISIVDIIMPKGKMKRYVDFIIGILIIFTIISPFTRLRNINFNLDREIRNFNDETISSKEILNKQEDQIEQIYLSNLSNELKEIVERDTGYRVKAIDIETLPDEQHLFILDEISLVLEYEKVNSKDGIKIQKIEVGEEYLVVDNTSKVGEIKTLVANNLGIEFDRVKISILDEGDKYGGNN